MIVLDVRDDISQRFSLIRRRVRREVFQIFVNFIKLGAAKAKRLRCDRSTFEFVCICQMDERMTNLRVVSLKALPKEQMRLTTAHKAIYKWIWCAVQVLL
jgi:hypothetical protein